MKKEGSCVTICHNARPASLQKLRWVDVMLMNGTSAAHGRERERETKPCGAKCEMFKDSTAFTSTNFEGCNENASAGFARKTPASANSAKALLVLNRAILGPALVTERKGVLAVLGQAHDVEVVRDEEVQSNRTRP